MSKFGIYSLLAFICKRDWACQKLETSTLTIFHCSQYRSPVYYRTVTQYSPLRTTSVSEQRQLPYTITVRMCLHIENYRDHYRDRNVYIQCAARTMDVNSRIRLDTKFNSCLIKTALGPLVPANNLVSVDHRCQMHYLHLTKDIKRFQVL